MTPSQHAGVSCFRFGPTPSGRSRPRSRDAVYIGGAKILPWGGTLQPLVMSEAPHSRPGALVSSFLLRVFPLLLLAPSGFAQTISAPAPAGEPATAPQDPQSTAEEPRAVYANETHLEEAAFGELRVEGRLHGPGGTVTMVRRTASFPPMIRLRREFTDEIITSTELIR